MLQKVLARMATVETEPSMGDECSRLSVSVSAVHEPPGKAPSKEETKMDPMQAIQDSQEPRGVLIVNSGMKPNGKRQYTTANVWQLDAELK